MPASDYLELLDWRRRVAVLFAELRQRPADAATLTWFRNQKDSLFKEHPQSPILEADRKDFPGLNYWPFDPTQRVRAHFTAIETEPPQAPPSQVAFRRNGRISPRQQEVRAARRGRRPVAVGARRRYLCPGRTQRLRQDDQLEDG